MSHATGFSNVKKVIKPFFIIRNFLLSIAFYFLYIKMEILCMNIFKNVILILKG